MPIQLMSIATTTTRYKGSIWGGFLISAPLIPFVAAVVSIGVFIAQLPKGLYLPGWAGALVPFISGTAFALVVWLLFALFYRPFTSVDRANVDSYTSLINRLSKLETNLRIYSDLKTAIEKMEAVPTEQSKLSMKLPDSKSIAQQEAQECLETIRTKLVKNSVSWVLSSGYIDLWNQMDTAEEAFIEFELSPIVIRDAIHDEMRLQGSAIENSDNLLNQLRLAVQDIDPMAIKYLKGPPKEEKQTFGGWSDQSEPSSQVSSNYLSPKEVQARSILRNVRQTLNAYREDRWSGLVSARNQLVGTMGFAALALYILLEVSLIAGANRTSIITATVFFLVGAMSGLFSRLYNESQPNMAIDDYRLARARLLFTPLFSGLAAIAGVLVTQNFLSGLIVAAIFGLALNILVNIHQKKADIYKRELQSTEATGT